MGLCRNIMALCCLLHAGKRQHIPKFREFLWDLQMLRIKYMGISRTSDQGGNYHYVISKSHYIIYTGYRCAYNSWKHI